MNVHQPPERTSTLLQALGEGAEEDAPTLGEIVAGLRNRAYGFSLLIFALPCCLPMPPGVPAVCGVAIMVVAAHLLLGREQLWLPARIARHTIQRRDLRRLVARVLPYIQRLERVCRPRLAVATERPAKTVIGLATLVLGLILVLPIPFLGNLPPGIATAIIAVGLTERDGLIVLAGLFAAAVAVAVTSAMTWAALRGLTELF